MKRSSGRRRFIITALTALLACGACGDKPNQAHKFAGATMGTYYHVEVVALPPAIDQEQLQQQVADVLGSVEQSMSTYIEDSEISRFNDYADTDWFNVSAEFCAVVAAAQHLSANTYGAFDVTVGPLVNLWGFGPDPATIEPPDATKVEDVLRRTGYELLRADCDRSALAKSNAALQIDLSAFAKGYGVDRVTELLDGLGLEQYLVEVGGELRVAGMNSRNQLWSIGVESPQRDARAIGLVIALKDQAMATSGDYRNFFEYNGVNYSHVIDPRTGHPVTHNAAAVTVVADTTAAADGMATALLVMGPEEGLLLAEQQELAAMFQIRRGDEIHERRSSQFAHLVAKR